MHLDSEIQFRGPSCLTVDPAPAGDVAGVVVGEDVASGRDAAQLDGVTQGHRLRQLDQGDVISEWRVINVVLLYCITAH